MTSSDSSQAQLQGFEMAHSNIHPIVGQSNEKISEKSRSEAPAQTEGQQPERPTHHCKPPQVEKCGQKVYRGTHCDTP